MSSLACYSLVFSTLLAFASGCHNLPAGQMLGNRAYILQQRMECKGQKVYDIENVQSVDQCKEACIQYDCVAMNLFQMGEFKFNCEILQTVDVMVPATGAACYYADDSAVAGGGYGGWGGYGRRRK